MTGFKQIKIEGIINREEVEVDMLKYISDVVGLVRCLKILKPTDQSVECHGYVRFWDEQNHKKALEELERMANENPETHWRVDESRAAQDQLYVH